MSTSTSGGVGFVGLLVIVLTGIFVVLQLCNVIAWSWWLVFLPVILYVGLSLLVFIIAAIGVLIVAVIASKRD